MIATARIAAWEALLPEFRALGGLVDNIARRSGPRGAGLFAIDPLKPVRLKVPARLLIPASDVELREGQLEVRASSSLGMRERTFFERYQRELSWGAGVRDELWNRQQQWSELPRPLQRSLGELGAGESSDRRFAPPCEQLCFRQFLATRVITYRRTPVLMPLLELINHSAKGVAYDPGDGDGVTVGGVFDDEVLVDYNFDDCWGRALLHGFGDATDHALSLAFQYQNHEFGIRIDRFHGRCERFAEVSLPIVSVENHTVRFSHLMLAHTRHPSLPRAIFQHVMCATPIRMPDELFDLIQHYNRQQFLKFLRVSEPPGSPLETMLREAAWQQLATLSHYWGTASLTPASS